MNLLSIDNNPGYIRSARNYGIAGQLFANIYSIIEKKKVTSIQREQMKEFFLLMRKIDYLYDAKHCALERETFFKNGLALFDDNDNKDHVDLIDLLGRDVVRELTVLIKNLYLGEELKQSLEGIHRYWEIQKTTIDYKIYVQASLLEWEQTGLLSSIIVSAVMGENCSEKTKKCYVDIGQFANLVDNIADIKSDKAERLVTLSVNSAFYSYAILVAVKKLFVCLFYLPFDFQLFRKLSIWWVRETIKNNLRVKAS